MSDGEVKALPWTTFVSGCTQPELVQALRECPVAAEARGTDATGIAYNSGGKRISISAPARPLDAVSGFWGRTCHHGHTRAETQGNSIENGNNHPFLGHIKGDNPLCLYHYPAQGLYPYASTEELLPRALSKIRLPKLTRVEPSCGDILQIDTDGMTARGQFDAAALRWSSPLWGLTLIADNDSTICLC